MTSGAKLVIHVKLSELEKFAGKKLSGNELYRLKKKLPDAIWEQIGDDGMKALVRGILE